MPEERDNELELLYLTGERTGDSFPLPEGETLVGRSHSCQLEIDDPLVSRMHARIEVKGGIVTVEDLGSAHGTFLNEKRLRGAVSLSPWDVIQFGDTRLRFSSGDTPSGSVDDLLSDDEEDPPAPDGKEEDDRTDISRASRGSETGFMVEDRPDDGEDGDNTRVIGGGKTRLIDDAELRGVKAARVSSSSTKTRRRIAIAAAAIACLSAVVLIIVKCAASPSAPAGRRISDAQYAFSMAIPGGCKKTSPPPGAISSHELRIKRQRLPAQIVVYADTDPIHAVTGLQAGFEDYSGMLETRHDGFRLLGSQPMQVANLRTVFYAFESPKHTGKGIFLFSGDKRICVECSAPAGDDAGILLSKTFPRILSSFRLAGEQQYIDFPMPDRALKIQALSSKDELKASALRALEQGEDLLKHSQVRDENLYMARESLAACLTMATALGDKPEFYERTAAALLSAGKALDEAVKDRKFFILAAEQRGDRQQAYWESIKLQQMVPDKTSEPYQFAAKRVRDYSAGVEKR